MWKSRRAGLALASESAVAAPSLTRCRCTKLHERTATVGHPCEGVGDGGRQTRETSQGGRGNLTKAGRFFGRQVNGMGGQRTPRCALRA